MVVLYCLVIDRKDHVEGEREGGGVVEGRGCGEGVEMATIA